MKHIAQVVGMIMLSGFCPAYALAGPHCCPIIVEDVKLIAKEQLKPNATIHIPVPILGKSTHRTRGHPSVVMMSVHLPSNYDPAKSHPVVVHLGGGVDQRKFIGRWSSITGNKDFIVLLAEYTSRLDSGPRNAAQMLRILEAATPIKHGSVILAGISSGSWGMNSNFNDTFYTRGFMDPWDAFIFIAGNNNANVTVTAEKLRGRPALFVGGNTGKAHAIQKKTHETIKAAGGDSTFIDMQAPYDDFPKACDPKIMEWITNAVLAEPRQLQFKQFEKQVSDIASVPVDAKSQAYLKALSAPLHHFKAKSLCVTEYLKLARAEKTEEKRKDMIAKLKAIPNLPVTQGGDYQDQLVWLKGQPGCEEFAKVLGRNNPFIEPVVSPPNGYGPGVDFRAR